MSPSNFPNMATVLPEWFQPLTFGVVTKTVVAFDDQEVMTEINFFGVWQPFSPRQLEILPEGQRSWSNIMVHSKTDLHLKNDDVIIFETIQYRVMNQNDYHLNGYYEYMLIQDYTNSGPVPV